MQLHTKRFGIVAALAVVTAAATFCPAGPKVQVRQLEGVQPPAAGEHPRLIVRKGDDLEALKAQAETEWGGKVTARLAQALKLMDHLAISGRNREVIKEGGFKAAGYASQYLLTGKAPLAAEAADLAISRVVSYPMNSGLDAMDRSSRLHGVALTYDLAYDGWSETQRKKVRHYLRSESKDLIEKVGGLSLQGRKQPDHIASLCAAGLAELAILGDEPEDKDARKRIDAIEKAVIEYLESFVGDDGYDVHGESVRQVAMASAILPFAHAMKLNLGRDITGAAQITNAYRPMIYQVVPEAGIAVTGQLTAAMDRSGLLAQVLPLTPESQKPAAAWLFYQLNGEKHLGIVRPHQGLYMLQSGLEDVKPAAPDDETLWPHLMRSETAGMAGIRSGWSGRDDILVMVYGASLRILGNGAKFAAKPMQHAHIYSHDRGAGAIDNAFQIDAVDNKSRMYHTRSNSRFVKASGEGQTVTMVIEQSGTAKRARETYTIEKRVDGKKVKQTVEVPEGGDYSGKRICGIDLTGKSGHSGLIVLADTLKGAGRAPRAWTLHAGYNCSIETNGNRFTVNGPNGPMHGVVLAPAEVQLKSSSNAPYTNFVSFNTDGETVHVVLTIGERAPSLDPGKDSLEKGVKVGKRTVKLNGDEVSFE
ncbi:MAG: hypothetical protein ACLFUJ_03415 [Phycisphaerae bacterium]